MCSASPTPRVGLLNIGEEDTKGHELVQEAHELIRASGVNYLGFVEGNHIFDENVDVVVTDGFTGNVALKAMEGLAKLIVEQLRTEFSRNMTSKLSGLLARPVLRRVGEKLDPRRYNGACMVGLTAVVVKSHGSADRVAFAQAVATAATAMRRGLPAAIASALAEFADLDALTEGAACIHVSPARVPTFRKRSSRISISKRRWIPPTSGSARAPASNAGTSRPRAKLPSTSAKSPRGAPSRPRASRPAEIDFIVFGTTTPDLVFPNCGTLLQARLGARGCPAFSVETACSGFIYALSIADKFVKAGEAKCALVVGAETLSRITNWSDRNTAVLFGDGAGAVVLKPSAEPGIMSTHLHSDGAYKDLLYVDSGVSKGFKIDPATNKVDIGIKMAGSEVFKVAVTKLGGAVDEALAHNGLEKSAVNWLIPHQANIRIISAMAKRLELPMERVIVTVQDHGNTSTASVPLALDVGVRDGRVKRGDLLLLEAFGGGFTWGSALVRF